MLEESEELENNSQSSGEEDEEELCDAAQELLLDIQDLIEEN